MTSSQIHVYLIGDQTYNISQGLHRLFYSNNEVLLISFFEQSFFSLREEVRKLPLEQRVQLPRFSNFADLLVLRRGSNLHLALDQALSAIYQLGTFISQCSKNGGIYPQPADTYLVGLCTGALTAAAISSCRSLVEFLPVAVHTVVVAFRTGICAVDVGRRIEKPSNGNQAPWSMVFTGITLQDISQTLRDFALDERLPLGSVPYVSAYSEVAVTVSGPPSVLEKLSETKLAHLKISKIPIYAPYHASHLFSNDDIESILETTSAQTWSVQPAHIPVFSSASGELVWAGNFRSVLKSSLIDILLKPLRWDALVQSISRLTAGMQATIHPISTNAELKLRAAIRGRDKDDGPMEVLHVEPDSPQALECSLTSRELSNIVTTGRPDRSKIAIIGMSGRFPNADDPSAFWELLKNGLDVHNVVPARSWNNETHFDRTGKRKNTSATPYGCWLEHPDLFDSKFFYISPREAPQVDPAQRMALMTVYEAIEQAGIVPDGSPSTQKDRVGVYFGCTSQDWMETNSPQDIDTYYIPGGNRAFIPGRINYFFKFSGPSLSIDTACSSSLAAINAGCLSLWRGDTDTVIAGGTNVLTNPDPTAGLDRGHFLSRTGNCKTFDDSADGYCRGEGVGAVILKRLEDAITDNDPIQAVILSAYTNHSAEAESITRPHVGAQREIFSKILGHRGTDPYDVSYIEMHGTGTQAGDNSEMTSVLEVFAPPSGTKRRDDQKLYVGSAKANIGHGEAFSGVGSLAKVLLMMRNDTIPPHVGIKTKINSKFPKDLTERKVLIASSPIPWKRPVTGLRKVMINNFSAAGGNSALLLEDAPIEMVDGGKDPRSSHLIAVSAQSAKSLKGNIESLISFIGKASDDSLLLPRLSYTTTARRNHHNHRVMVNGSSLKEVRSKLQTAIHEGHGATRSAASPKLLFTFTGQGSQYPGMGMQLFESFSSFRSDINRYDRIAQSQGFPSIKSFFTGSGGDIGNYEPLTVQVATTCLQIALSRLWSSWGIVAQAVVGHSLGEYAALVTAGVLAESDAIYLVGKRAELLQAHCKRATHSMMAVKSSLRTIEPFLKGKRVEIACINSPDEIVVSGKNEDVRAVQKLLTGERMKTAILGLPYAFHSSQVDPILKDLESLAHGITFRKPTLPVLSTLQAKVITESGVFGSSYLSHHCRQPVNLLGAINAASETEILKDISFVLEIGPQPVVSGMVKATLGCQIVALSSMQRNKDIWPIMTDALSKLYVAGAKIEWQEYHRDFGSSHKVLQLPAYSWDLQSYWIQYVHDWSLRKGDPPLMAEKFATSHKSLGPRLESTTIHRVVEETVDDRTGLIIVESDIARSDLCPLVQGHKVNGVPLVTATIYADMALTIGSYLLDRYQPKKKERLIDITDMILESALVGTADDSQLMRVSAKIDWLQKSVLCEFLSVDATGKTRRKHAKCTVRYEDPIAGKHVQLKTAAVQSRIQKLYAGLQDGTTYRFSKSMAYKMVQSLAQFDPSYQYVSEIVLDSKMFESTSKVSFAESSKSSKFHTNPAHINAFAESGGFVMNCNESSDLDKEIFVNHGWKSFRIYEKLCSSKTYQTHVKMHETQDGMWEGDVMVLSGDKIVAKFRSILLQCVPRRLMNLILAQALGKKAQVQPGEDSEATESLAKPLKPAETKSTKKVDEPKRIMRVLKIISQESGVALGDLVDDRSFVEMGVDSLLSLIISSRIKEEVGVNTESWEFADYPTVKHLREFMDQGDGNANTRFDEGEEEKPSVAPVESLESSPSSCGLQNATCLSDLIHNDHGDVSATMTERRYNPNEVPSQHPTESDSSQASTPQDSGTPSAGEDQFSAATHGATGTALTSSTEADDLDSKPALIKIRPATSVLLQGRPQACKKTLFLFADGAGSASSYSKLPRVNNNLAIIGLNSPYARFPEEMTCTLDQLLDEYLAELHRRQPIGPYNLGGWSAGGILAYCATQRLIWEGEKVDNLLIIDSPVPQGLDKLPQRFMTHCLNIGLWEGTVMTGKSAPPERLFAHFRATMNILNRLYAEPLLVVEGQTLPRCSILFATESIMTGDKALPPGDDEVEDMKFLTEKRTDFSPGGWRDLIPGGDIVVDKVIGAHHFSMMWGEFSEKTARFIDRATQ